MIHNAIQLATFEVQKRSLNTYAGLLWSLVGPLSQIGLLYFVLTFVFKSQNEHLLLWLVSGLSTWIVIQTAILRTCNSLVSRRALIQNNNIPHRQLVAADLMSEFFVIVPFFCIGVIAAFVSHTASLNLLLVPFVIVILLVFLFGVGLVLATLTPMFRDIPYLAGLALQIAFWLTPVAYSKVGLDERVRFVVSFNPLTYFVELSQKAFLNQAISWQQVAIPTVIAVVAAGMGLYVSHRLGRKIVLHL